MSQSVSHTEEVFWRADPQNVACKMKTHVAPSTPYHTFKLRSSQCGCGVLRTVLHRGWSGINCTSHRMIDPGNSLEDRCRLMN
jgi:hypothetical protein